MKALKTTLLALLALLFIKNPLTAQGHISSDEVPIIKVDTSKEPMAEGVFEPTWESLRQYEVPEWYKNAKFGIWAHWGPQSQPEAGDWYARHMYSEGHWQYNYHLEKYGHPSEFGFKEVINDWQADQWDPEKLVALYKKAGAQYFFAMANHHDNFDLWDSKYHKWNAVNLGPKKDLIAGWAAAARKVGLPLGLSMHSAHAWSWYEPSRGADSKGEKEGVPYDGHLTLEDGVGTWWEGYDPQELYAQSHPHSEGWEDIGSLHNQWNWGHGASLPDQAYSDNFYNRAIDLVTKYQPDLIYFDDTALPLWPVSDAGLQFTANFYNRNTQWHDGQLNAVVFGKILSEDQRKAIVWEIEKGIPNEILPYNWQCCTCLGRWHYDRALYNRDGYKNSQLVIQLLMDIVSKNGNLLLSVPLRGNGSIDDKAEKIVEEIGEWMSVNRESVFDTRPWKVFGEGPSVKGSAMKGQGFNEPGSGHYTNQDIRFTTKDDVLYAIVMDSKGKTTLNITSLAKDSPLLEGRKIKQITQLGAAKTPAWEQKAEGLSVAFEGEGVVVLKIKGAL